MNFITPSGLLFALLAIPIIAMYLLTIRRREVEISSTMLWRMVLRDRQANAPWQKLRRNLLLLLQLVILSGLVLAAARLAFPGRAIASGSVVLLLDGTASMLAEDGAPTRFDLAVQIAQNIAEETSSGAEITAILVGREPAIILGAETDKSRIAEAFENAGATTARADWGAALALAAGIGRQSQAGDLTYILISDGGIPNADLPALPGDVRFIPVGERGENLAINAFEARALPGSAISQLFLRLVNFGEQSRTALLRISRDETVLLDQQVRLEPGESLPLTVDAGDSSRARFVAELRNVEAGAPLDIFPPDDRAYTAVAPTTNRRVYLVSEGNIFLERLLLLLPDIIPLRLVPDNSGLFRLPEDPNGVFILDGQIPGESMPDGDLLLLNPPENELFDVFGELESVGAGMVLDHPLSEQLSWESVHIRLTKRIGLPVWGQVLVDSDQTPLVFVGEQAGRRVAVVGFDLHESDLPLQVGFPILFSRLIGYLAPPQAVERPNGTLPLESVAIRPPADAHTVRVTTPSGEILVYEAGNGTILFSDTAETGIYQVEISSPAGSAEEAFSVNFFDPQESTILPVPSVNLGQEPVPAAVENQVANREIWIWLLVFALAFILIEWLAYHRRLGLPQPKTR